MATSDRPAVNKAVFSTQPMAEPWNPTRPVHRRSGAGRNDLAQAQPASLGDMDPGRLADFAQGVKESYDRRAAIAVSMVGTYIGVRALQHWRR